MPTTRRYFETQNEIINVNFRNDRARVWSDHAELKNVRRRNRRLVSRNVIREKRKQYRRFNRQRGT